MSIEFDVYDVSNGHPMVMAKVTNGNDRFEKQVRPDVADDVDHLIDDVATRFGSEASGKLQVMVDDVGKQAIAAFKPQTVNDLILDPSNPLPSVRLYRDEFHKHPEGYTILEYLGDFYVFNRKHFAVMTEAEIKSKLYHYLENAKRWNKDSLIPFGPNRNNVANMIEALRALTFVKCEAPAWLDGNGPDPRQLIIANNGIIQLCPTGKPVMIGAPTPRLFALNALEFDYMCPERNPVRWVAFLRQLWPDSPESIETLQMWFGYCLVADTRQQKALMLVGPKRSGKGTICRILTRLLGVSAVCGPTLSGMATNFGLWGCIGKLLAIISDARLSGKADQAIIVERLLALTGEDLLQIDRKNLQPLEVRLFIRLMLVSNELPKLNDASGALASRFIILQLTQSYFGREDIDLEDKLAEEMPSILDWAIVGWQKLQQRGKFIIPQSSVDAVAEMEDLASPVKAFIRDFCKAEPLTKITVDAMYDAWCCWCESEGRPPGNKQVFGRDLRAAMPEIQCKQHRDEDGRHRSYEGIRLSAAAAESTVVWISNRDKKRSGGNHAS